MWRWGKSSLENDRIISARKKNKINLNINLSWRGYSNGINLLTS